MMRALIWETMDPSVVNAVFFSLLIMVILYLPDNICYNYYLSKSFTLVLETFSESCEKEEDTCIQVQSQTRTD
jgi:hypothetical protein